MACTPLQQPSGISYPLGTGRCSTVLKIRTANRIVGSVTSFDRSAFGSEPGICCQRIEVVATRVRSPSIDSEPGDAPDDAVAVYCWSSI